MPGCLDQDLDIALNSRRYLGLQMEAGIDINEYELTDPTTNIRDTGQEDDVQKISMLVKNSESGNSSCLTSSTPIVEQDKNGFLYQRPAFQSNDSGFSDGTFSSTPSSSIGGTPCTSLISSVSSHALPLQKQQPSFPDCDVSPIHRKTFPIRFRRHRHSDPCLRTLAMRIQLMEDNDCLPKQSHSSYRMSVEKDENESESKSEIEKITSITENSLKRNLLHEVVDRSRSCSLSLSSASDELEASLQEMSLEESSSESGWSPASLNSLSPIFSFPPVSKSRPLSPLVQNASGTSSEETRNVTLDLVCDKKFISENETLLDTAQNLEINSYEKQHPPKGNVAMNKLTFAANLSLTPKFSVPEPYLSMSPSSSSNNETVMLDESTCDNTIVTGVNHHGVDFTEHDISTSCSASFQPLLNTDISAAPFQAFVSDHSPIKSCPDDQDFSHLPQSLSPCPESNLLKSPTKRTSCGQSATSPLKMRKKMSLGGQSQRFNVKNVRRDLMSVDLLPSHPQSNQAEPLPQFLNIGLLPDQLSDDNIQVHTPISSKGLSLSSCDYKYGASSCCIGSSELRLQNVIDSFSPAEPSRLIGRRVGLLKCDIIGELAKLNFLGCLEIIFKCLPDKDLLSVLNVSPMWRGSLCRDPYSFLRYRKTRQAQRKIKLLLGKENSPVKSNDNSELPDVTASKGPLHPVQQAIASPELPPTHSEDAELLWDDTLRVCPACYGTALVHPAENRAVCQKGNCAYVFCTLCFSAFHHPHPCKPLFHATSKTDLAGTRKSKKNLRRL